MSLPTPNTIFLIISLAFIMTGIFIILNEARKSINYKHGRSLT